IEGRNLLCRRRNGADQAVHGGGLGADGDEGGAFGDEVQLVAVIGVEAAMPIHVLGIEVGDGGDVGGEVDIGGLVGRKLEHYGFRAVGRVERGNADIAGE